VFQEISRYDEPESVAYYAASEVFWSDQALGRPILGPTEMIRTIPCETIMAYMADNRRASRMVLSVSGNID
jgi:predicted Zn-dependent peptidase